MQTFLPYSSFADSARILDRARLGKQRVEAKQIFLSLTQVDYGWKNHPAVKMWAGYENALCLYGILICEEWRRRGYRDSLQLFFFASLDLMQPIVMPPWLGRKDFHLSHRSQLFCKQPKYYKHFNWNVPLFLPYVWPV